MKTNLLTVEQAYDLTDYVHWITVHHVYFDITDPKSRAISDLIHTKQLLIMNSGDNVFTRMITNIVTHPDYIEITVEAI